MKKKILFLVLLVGGIFSTHAQEHHLSGGYGVGSTNHLLNHLSEIGSVFSGIFFHGHYLNNPKNIGEFRFSYAYSKMNRWEFGGTVSFNRGEFEVYQKSEKIADRSLDVYTIAGETAFNLINNEKFKMYSLLGAGVSLGTAKTVFLDNTDNTSARGGYFNFQISLVGVRYGKDFGGFAE